MEAIRFFDEIDPEKRLGLGCMRLPLKSSDEGDVDYDLCDKMVDRFMEAGFNYFDTARVYHRGMSEKMIGKCIAARYDRSDFLLTDKLSDGCFRKEEDIRPLFEDQLKVCGVDYFDIYLMHAQDKTNYPKYQKTHAYEIAQELKAEGKIRHVGISFHDSADFLEQILDDHPEIEIVQIQFNYYDIDSPSVESGRLYEICEKRGLPMVVMEPVRGGGLAKLTDEQQAVFDDLYEDDGDKPSAASYAMRFCASFPSIAMVISGMGNMDMLEDNIQSFSPFEPIDDEELEAINKVKALMKTQGGIPCTACKYCLEGCPQKIRIPDLFSSYNAKEIFRSWNSNMYYEVSTRDGGKASDCIKCGKCEKACPQHLLIRDLLEKVAAAFGE